MGLEVKQRLVLVNRVATEGSLTDALSAIDRAVQEEAERYRMEIFAAIPSDSEVIASDLAQRSLLDSDGESPAEAVAEKVLDYLITVNQ